MSYIEFIQNKTINISNQRINEFLSITNTGNADFELKMLNISNEELLTKLIGLSNVGLNLKQLCILSEFTSFYCILNKMVCANLLLLKHSSKIGYQHTKILYRIGKGIIFNVGTLIQDEIVNQAKFTNQRNGLSFGHLITYMILAVGMPPIKDFDTTCCMRNIGRAKISRSST